MREISRCHDMTVTIGDRVLVGPGVQFYVRLSTPYRY